MPLWLQKINNLLSKFIRGMFGRILLSQITLTLLLVTLIGLMSFNVSERIINQQLVRINTATLNQVEENVVNLTRNVYQLASIVMLDSDIERILKSVPSDDVQKIYYEEEIGDIMSTYSLSFDPLRSHSLILGSNGSRFTATHDSSNVNLSDILKKNWYNDLKNNKNQLLWFEENPGFTNIPKEVPVITFAVNMKGQRSLNDYGVFFFSLEESVFYDLYKNLPDTGGKMYIMNSKGRVFSSSNHEMIGSNISSAELDSLLSSISVSSDLGLSQNNQYITLIKKVKNLDWYIVYSIPQATNFLIITHLKNEIAFIAFICVVLSFALALFIARYFSMPLVHLTKKISADLTLNSHTEKMKTHLSEVDFLSSEYETLIAKLDNTIMQLMKEQEDKRRAEFHALQMQINPHFLYNTLNSIKCLLWTNRIDLIEPTMNALIKLFRQTISRRDEMLDLEDEIDCIRNYIFIQEIRTNYSIELFLHLPNEYKKYKVPKLLLQPIIENAIFHGLEPKNSNGTITILCSLEKNALCIEIEDNGVGMDEVTASNLLNDNYALVEHDSNGIGLKNVNERIHLMYGLSYGITIQSRLGIGTQITLRLPTITDEEDSHV